MKILALEQELEGVSGTYTEPLLQAEAHHVFRLYLSDHIREIYFTENNNAVLILEAPDKVTAEKWLNELPLVKAGLIQFAVMELKPYTGYERILHDME